MVATETFKQKASQRLKAGNKWLCAQVSADDLSGLKIVAKDQGVSMSTALERAIESYVVEYWEVKVAATKPKQKEV